jgi:predicted GNAT family N-acyltransferase
MAQIISFRSAEQPGLASQAHQIRELVFVEEQGVDPELEYDEFEDEAMHYLLYAEGVPVSTARWRISGEGIKLERFATLRDYRNRGLGSILLKKLMEDIIPLGEKIYLHSQLKAIPFYNRHGFVKSGKQFSEADIEHYKMIYRPALQKNKKQDTF